MQRSPGRRRRSRASSSPSAGGVIGDITGFAASTALRGVRFCPSPGDAPSRWSTPRSSGKTGIDLASGKNLVGTFHQPSAVVNAISRTWRRARRESERQVSPRCVKIGFLADPRLIARLWSEDAAHVAERRSRSALLPVVRRAVAGEGSIRRLWTSAIPRSPRDPQSRPHDRARARGAWQASRGYLHGEAVAIGQCRSSSRPRCALGLTRPHLAERGGARCSRLRPADPDRRAPSSSSAWRHTATDKKRAGATLRWPVVTQIWGGARASPSRSNRCARRSSTCALTDGFEATCRSRPAVSTCCRDPATLLLGHSPTGVRAGVPVPRVSLGDADAPLLCRNKAGGFFR